MVAVPVIVPFVIVVVEVGILAGLVVVPLIIDAAEATPASAVTIATTANTFAKCCGFINVPPVIFDILYHLLSNGGAKLVSDRRTIPSQDNPSL
jgi:hypothetical protein